MVFNGLILEFGKYKNLNMLQESKYQHYSMGHGSEFPSERYISEKTGKPINLIYFGSLVMLPEIIKYVVKCGFTKIHETNSYLTQLWTH